MPQPQIEDLIRDRLGRFAEKQHSDAADVNLADAQPAWRTETHRQKRGHDFYPDDIDTWPAMYATEEVAAPDKRIVAKYFGPAGDWWITEIDQRTGEAFGYAQLAGMQDMAEWGYIDMSELESLTAPLRIRTGDGTVATASVVAVERDLDFEVGTLARDTIPAYRR